MGDLDIVNEDNNIIGKSSFGEAHNKGLRHRSVQIFVFEDNNLETLLIAQRSQKQETSALKLHPSASGHIKLGQTYLEAAIDEFREELFNNKRLPSSVVLAEVARYPNDTRPTNKEITCLFYTIYPGPFSIDKMEIEKIYWQNRNETWEKMHSKSEDYTTSFINAMREFRKFQGEKYE